MYSVVLLVAMTGSADVDTALFNKGCSGGCYGSCYGCSGCSGCWGGCYGCSGGKHHGCCGGGFFSKHHKHGCCGGSYGCCGGSYGCCGGGWGCCGGKHHKHGCCGGGFFSKHHKHGCCGGSYGCCGGSYGCCGGYSCGGGCYGCVGGTPVITVPTTGTPTMGAPATTNTKTPPAKEVKKAAPATIIVSLPVGARLTIDDAATTSTAARRVFVSPSLPAGQEFHYTLKAEFVRDGKTVNVTKEIGVRAGDETNVDLNADLARVASR